MAVTPLRAHRPRPLLERLACSLGVSAVTTALSTGLLVLLAVGMGVDAGTANAIGVVCGIPVSYVGNRRWVWRRTGRSALLREVVPFWSICLLGLAVSTLVVGRVGAATAALPATWRVVILPIANAATFGVLWLVQFALLDRVIFRTSRPRPAPSFGDPSRASGCAA
jgi:putative flippase GtrA